MIKGEVKATALDGKDRRLDKGAPIYVGDTLNTSDKSFVVVVFRDDSRLTLRPSSAVVLKDYLLSQEKTADNAYVTELLKGGLRTLTGNIGKTNPDGFKVQTASSTMGIRGTGFDVYYENPTWINVWSGNVVFGYKDGSILVGSCAGPSGGPTSVPARGKCTVAKYDGTGVPEYLKDLPKFMQWPADTRPDNTQFKGLFKKLFEVREHDYSKPGLYVTAYDGHIRVNDVNIGRLESLFSNGKETYRLQRISPFQWNDPYPKPGEINERLLDLFGLFGGSDQCEVQ
jgi:hypothetical protein